MNMNASTNYVEIAKAVGAVLTPIAVVFLAYIFQKRQKAAEAAMAARQKAAEAAMAERQKVAEATMAERIKRIGTMSPLLNKIFAYCQRVGDFLNCSPEDILSAKREADREFWTFEYLWSPAFKGAYDNFMSESFETFTGEGKKANIHAESKYYPKKASTSGWVAFSETAVNKTQNQQIYNALQSAIARDLGFRG